MTRAPEPAHDVQDHGVVQSEVRLRPLPAPDYLEFALPEGYVYVVTDDGGPLSVELAAHLSQEGWRVMLLALASAPAAKRDDSSLPQGVVRAALTPEEPLGEQIAAIQEAHGPVGAFVHVHPASEPDPASILSLTEGAQDVVKEIFLLAGHLKDPLTGAAQAGRSCFVTVTRLDGALGLLPGLATGRDFDGHDAALTGLVKTLRLEWDGVFCRAVDLDPALDPEEATRIVLAELHDPNRLIAEVGHGPRGRVTLEASL